MKIFRIIRAKLKNKDKIKDDWYYKRLSICETCPLNSKNSEGDHKKTFKYKFWNLLNLYQHFCTVCGCEIKAKASEELEVCSLVELDLKPKWEQEI